MKNINLPDHILRLHKVQNNSEEDIHLYDINCNEIDNTSIITSKAVASEEKYLKLSKLSPDFIGCEVPLEILREMLTNKEQYKKVMDTISLQYDYSREEENGIELYLGKVKKTEKGEYFLEPNIKHKKLYDEYVSQQLSELPSDSEMLEIFIEDDDEQR